MASSWTYGTPVRARRFTLFTISIFSDYLTNIQVQSQNETTEYKSETVMYSTLAALGTRFERLLVRFHGSV